MSARKAMQHREPDETSEALLASARHLLASEGPSALTVRRIASEAELSTMNVYSRFGGKDGILDILYREALTQLFGMLADVPRSRDVRTNLRGFTSAYRKFAIEHPHEYDLMFRSVDHDFSPSPQSRELARSLFGGLVGRVDAARADGTIRASIASNEVALWVWASCHGMLSLEFGRVGAEVVDWPATWDAAVEQMGAVLAPERSATPSRTD
jgi:AcrR family transcriptional regulator